MKNLFRPFGIAVAAIFLSAHAAYAQQAVEVRAQAQAARPSLEELQSPDIQSQTRQKSFTPRDWLEIEGAINIDVRPLPATGMVDRLVVKWYVAIKNPERSGEFFLLSREVTHVNVPIQEEIFTSVYLSPSSIRRITGNYRGARRSIERVGYEVIFNGEVVAQGIDRGAAAWWDAPSERISSNQSVPLMTKPETPFAAMWWDRYAEVAVDR